MVVFMGFRQITAKYLFTIVFTLTAFIVLGQDDASVKPAATTKTKKENKKMAKAEEKIHEKSQKDMDKQIGEFHKKKYQKVVKGKGKGKIPSAS